MLDAWLINTILQYTVYRFVHLWFTFQARSQNCEGRVLALSCPSVCLSVCPHGTSQLPQNEFSWNFIFDNFPKICKENVNFH